MSLQRAATAALTAAAAAVLALPAGAVPPAAAPAASPAASPVAAPASSAASCTADPSPVAGCELWSARYNHATLSPIDVEADFGNAVAASPDGARVFVTGRSWGGPSDYDLVTLAYDARTGDELWAHRFEGPGYDYGTAVVVSADGQRVYVVGSSGDPAFVFDYLVLAYDAATGAVLWSERFDGGVGGHDNAFAAGLTDDDGILVVTGDSDSEQAHGGTYPQSLDYATVAFDAETGATLWVARYDGGDQDQPFALAVGPDPREQPGDPGPAVYVTGRSASAASSADLVTVAYEATTGAERWVARHETAGFESGVSLGVTPDGATVVATGTGTNEDNGSADYLTIAYDAATGGERWVARFDGPSGNYDGVSALALSPNGTSAYVTGVSWNILHQSEITLFEADYLTIAYDVATGSERWRVGYDGGFRSDDVATGVAVSPDGEQVFVTGRSRVPGVWTYATLALRADDGATEWVARTAAGDGAWSEAAAVATDGERVYVTGSGMGPDWFDVLTVAYDTRPPG